MKVYTMDFKLYTICKEIFNNPEFRVVKTTVNTSNDTFYVTSYEAVCYINATEDYITSIVIDGFYGGNKIKVTLDVESGNASYSFDS